MRDFTARSASCWRSGLRRPPRPCLRYGSSPTSSRPAPTSCATCWPVTASPTPSTPLNPRMAGRGWPRPGRTARCSRSWSPIPGRSWWTRRMTRSRPSSGWPACPLKRPTWPSSAQARPGCPPRCTRPAKACRRCCSRREAFGGQAGSSSLIRNYLGFPRGISGAGLVDQGVRAGMVLWRHPLHGRAGHRPPAHRRRLHPAPGRRAGKPHPHRPDRHGRVLPQPRRPRPGLPARRRRVLRGGRTESSAFVGEHVFIACGANSAGQAAVNLARYAQQVTIVIRGDSLAARMSQYLIDEISAAPDIDVRTSTQIAAAEGTAKLEALTVKDTETGSTQTVPAAALVVLIGAVPHTDWLPGLNRPRRARVHPHREATCPAAATRRPTGPCRARRSPWRPACPAYRGRRRPPRLHQTRRLRSR